MGALKTAGHFAHRCFSWNTRVASAYLAMWEAAFRSITDDQWLKAHVRSNLLTFPWRAIKLPAKEVAIGGGVRALLLPRPGTLTYRTLLRENVAYEPEVFSFLAVRMGRYDTVAEMGANVGLFTLFFSHYLRRLDDTLRVFAFEPAPCAFALLSEHLRINGAGNVRALNAAVSPARGSVEFHPNERDLTKGSLRPDIARLYGGAPPIRVPSIGHRELAPLVSSFEHPLLKIDVMGAEGTVIAELESLLRAKAPDIVVGVWKENLDALNALAFLREDYRLFRIGPSGLESRETFSDAAYCNYFLESRRSSRNSVSSTSK